MKNHQILKQGYIVICIFLLHNLAIHAQQKSPDQRAKETEQKMTDDERFSLITSLVGYVPSLGIPKDSRIPDDISMSAGYTPGIPRLGIPNIQSTDASMGVTNPGYRPDDKGATAMPSSILLGASFNQDLAYQSGIAIAKEAKSRGFNVLLAGGINLIRDPRNGRNYEYYSEDPYATALFGASAVNGIQSQNVVSTLKHYSLNNNEVNRHWLNAVIDPAAHRESDLLSFQLAIEKSNPGSIMSGYNKINGEYASGNDYLLNEVLRKDWGYKGWVMSDWGAVPGWDYALKGLDQESGIQLDVMQWGAEAFTDSLKNAYKKGIFPKARLSEMVQRILRSLYAVGADYWKEKPVVDMEKHNEIALNAARQGIVMLKNDKILPIATDKPLKIAVIGGFAQLGIPCGTGSGSVMPEAGYAAKINIGGPGIMGGGRTLYLLPNSPLEELKKLLPNATIDYDPGYTIAESKILAKRSDLVIVFGVRVEGEGFDMPDLSLPWGQDELIKELSTVNPNTIVVLETGNPSSMPWRNNVKGIVQAWFSGQAGGTAIAEILTGKTNPSGRLPITFPEDLNQTPRPTIPEIGTPWGTPTTIVYNEGSDVGYRWFAKKKSNTNVQFWLWS
ncbi:glycoside hydrolase family 3 protein [Chryseobacterium oryctis]|uniref:Glycoside hydrolase family 3 protein n=1 Tax=Chryseobacterium oryctis TaxID=2952618 RepID=A0ABT3HPM1_9FLAO|nr:glycoside hydrolase family 3 protein [Chryseobacterium oryctis]MCW3161699.1 glycoside hydrolase family 3 protein [Chryseobacterium oryctis]